MCGASGRYLYMASCKQVFHQSPVGTAHASMMNSKAMRQDSLQVQIIAGLCFSLQAHKHLGACQNLMGYIPIEHKVCKSA